MGGANALTTMKSFLLSLFVAGAASAAVAAGPDVLVKLDYGTFQGAYSSTYNISYWQRIPYAAPPIGENRFRAPQPPLPIEGIYDSSRTFDMCPQRTVNGSEDCLYLGLYSRPSASLTNQKPRPVVVTFHGGGYIQGAASFSPPPSAYPILNSSAAADLIFVYPSYRLNAFGFLPGAQVRDDPSSDPNPGLRDQREVLRWVRRHIAAFGGDPDQITVWGQSAGGGSVIAQVLASSDAGGKEEDGKPLFARALTSSPFWSKTYRYDSPEAQDVYDTLANLTGCAGPGSLACLKSLDVQTIRDANLIIVDSHKYTTSSFTWGPFLDDDLLITPLSEARPKPGVTVPSGFGMYNAHEGENFVPATLSTESGADGDTVLFDAWLSGYLPWFEPCDLARVKRLYPPIGNISAVESYADSYTRAGLVFRDTVLACPAMWMARLSAEKGHRWLGEYTMTPSKHASDVYWWNSINSAQKEDPLHYEGYAGAFASFFMTGDPNALKLTAPEVAGVPSLDDGKRWVINTEGFAATPLAELGERCSFWKKLAPKIPI